MKHPSCTDARASFTNIEGGAFHDRLGPAIRIAGNHPRGVLHTERQPPFAAAISRSRRLTEIEHAAMLDGSFRAVVEDHLGPVKADAHRDAVVWPPSALCGLGPGAIATGRPDRR
jgi:hypothetical protein